jgi:hypothetical protein
VKLQNLARDANNTIPIGATCTITLKNGSKRCGKITSIDNKKLRYSPKFSHGSPEYSFSHLAIRLNLVKNIEMKPTLEGCSDPVMSLGLSCLPLVDQFNMSQVSQTFSAVL